MAGIGWIVDAEVRGDVESLDRTQRRAVRRTRVNDGRLVRRMGKGWRAGVRAAGVLTQPETGVGPGGVISPLGAQICLPQVVAEWVEREVQPRMRGRGVLLRVADDVVLGGAREADARTIMAVLPKRCARVGLRLHSTKTAVMACSKPATHQGSVEGNGTCDFLGLPHDWTRSRRGYGVRTRRTARTRHRRPTKSWWRWWRATRHAPLPVQYQRLGLQRRGHLRS